MVAVGIGDAGNYIGIRIHQLRRDCDSPVMGIVHRQGLTTMPIAIPQSLRWRLLVLIFKLPRELQAIFFPFLRRFFAFWP